VTDLRFLFSIRRAAKRRPPAPRVVPNPAPPAGDRAQRRGPPKFFLDRLDRALLVLGLAERKLGLEPLEPLVLELERLALGLLPPRVEGKQFPGQLAKAGAGAALQVLPGFATELGEGGCPAVGADVA